jgi:preprotein translocase subunit SecE
MSKIANYVRESYDELVHKVSWPTFKELQNSAVVVAVAALILALIVFIMDVVFGVQGVHENEGLGFWKGLLGYFYSLIVN